MCLLPASKCVKCVFACGNLFLNCDFVDRELDCVFFVLQLFWAGLLIRGFTFVTDRPIDPNAS
jgi:hypothetical protein